MKSTLLYLNALLFTLFILSACQKVTEGCIDPRAINFDAEANKDDGSCQYREEIRGCTNPYADNFNPEATIDDGSCMKNGVLIQIGDIPGCTNPASPNYNPDATVDDGSCIDPREQYKGNWSLTGGDCMNTLPLSPTTSIVYDEDVSNNVITFVQIVNNGGPVDAEIDQNAITIPEQSMNGFVNYSAIGNINEAGDKITLEITIGGFFPFTCTAEYTRI